MTNNNKRLNITLHPVDDPRYIYWGEPVNRWFKFELAGDLRITGPTSLEDDLLEQEYLRRPMTLWQIVGAVEESNRAHRHLPVEAMGSATITQEKGGNVYIHHLPLVGRDGKFKRDRKGIIKVDTKYMGISYVIDKREWPSGFIPSFDRVSDYHLALRLMLRTDEQGLYNMLRETGILDSKRPLSFRAAEHGMLTYSEKVNESSIQNFPHQRGNAVWLAHIKYDPADIGKGPAYLKP